VTGSAAGGPTESPFVVRRGSNYYLFSGSWNGMRLRERVSNLLVVVSSFFLIDAFFLSFLVFDCNLRILICFSVIFLAHSHVKGYSDTRVFLSQSPFTFGSVPLGTVVQVGEIPSHAPEIVRDFDGTWYITRAGWEQGMHERT
jgi:hypothetical protein